MERSEYEKCMDMLHIGDTLFCAILCGLALWERIQRCDAWGKPYTDIDLDEAAQEATRRMCRFHSHPAQQSDTNEEAAEDGGFSVPHFDNTS